MIKRLVEDWLKGKWQIHYNGELSLVMVGENDMEWFVMLDQYMISIYGDDDGDNA